MKFTIRVPLAHKLAHQRGQSTVEFVVLALVLTPLFIAVPLLGKYIDLMNATEAASRYVAFEAMARNSASSWKTDAELAAEVRRRFFSNSDASIKTADIAGDFAAHRNPIWTDHTGRPFLDRFEQDVSVRTKVDSRRAVPAANDPLLKIADSLDLSERNWYTASVTVRAAAIPEFAPFDKADLSINRRTVLLTDAWTARSAADVRSRIEGSPKTYPPNGLRDMFNLVGMVPPTIYDPRMRMGDHDWDVVPCDRLIGGC
jgi:Flp pilus assembly protein TadG